MTSAHAKEYLAKRPGFGGKQKGAGRPKGSQSKHVKDLREAVNAAFQRLGGVSYLVKVGQEDPKTFCALLSKVIPAEVNANINVTYQNTSDVELRNKLEQMMALKAQKAQEIDITPNKEEDKLLINSDISTD